MKEDSIADKSVACGNSIRWMTVVFALLFPGIATWLYFDAFPGKTMTAVCYGANKAVQVILPAIWVGLVLRRRIVPARPSGKSLMAGMLTGAAIAAALWMLYVVALRDILQLGGTPAAVSAKLAEFGSTTPVKLLAFGLFIIIVNSAVEEYYWRWFVFGEMAELCPVWCAAVVSSIGFTFHHAVIVRYFLQASYFSWQVLFLAGCTGLGGVIWAWLRWRTGSVFPAWISHIWADIPIIAAGFDLMRGQW